MEEIDLKELLNIFWERKFEILIFTLIFIIVGAVYSYTLVEPKYTSYTTVLLTQVSDNKNDDNTKITQTDLTLNSNLVPTYSELIKSNAVIRTVIDSLNIDELKESDLKNNVSVTAISNTEMIKIAVTNVNPNYASLIANKIAEVFSEKIEDIYKINNVYVVDRAEVSSMPSNVNHVRDIVIFALVGIVVGAIYALIINMADNAIKTEEDIEKVTGLMTLASIPDYDTEAKGGKR